MLGSLMTRIPRERHGHAAVRCRLGDRLVGRDGDYCGGFARQARQQRQAQQDRPRTGSEPGDDPAAEDGIFA